MLSLINFYMIILPFIICKISMSQGQKYCNITREYFTTVKIPHTFSYLSLNKNSDGSVAWIPTIKNRDIIQNKRQERIIQGCCPGYKKRGNDCIPYCQQPCVYGKCTGPHTCTCNEGYQYLTQFKCQPKCDNCNHGVCVAPGKCNCYPDYQKSENGTCIPICSNECINGFCSAPDICSCNEGYYLNETINFLTTTDISVEDINVETTTTTTTDSHAICQPHCDENCENGYCSAPNTCTCNKGYLRESEFVCIPECLGCTNGICIGPKQCICNPGYKMNLYSNECEPICTKGCSSGICIEPEICKCNEGFVMKKHSVSSCIPNCIPECQHNEFCYAPNECRCALGYRKNNETSGICEPHCFPKCINSKCTSPYYCQCIDGYKKDLQFLNQCNPICDDCDDDMCIGHNICLITTTSDTTISTSTEKSLIEYNDYDYSTESTSYESPESTSYESSESNEFIDIKISENKQLKSNFSENIDILRKWNDNSCNRNCTNGICLNGTCYCEDGYIGFDCPQFCSNDCGTNGYCFDDINQCTCFTNIELNYEKDCNTFCDRCSEFSICILPSECNCTAGYEKNSFGLCIPICSIDNNFDIDFNSNYSIYNGCLNGTCIQPNVCKCDNPKMILNPLNKFECIYSIDLEANNNHITKENIKISNIKDNLWLICLLVLIVSGAIVILAVIAYKKQKNYNVDKKEKDFGAYLYKDGTVYHDEPN